MNNIYEPQFNNQYTTTGPIYQYSTTTTMPINYQSSYRNTIKSNAIEYYNKLFYKINQKINTSYDNGYKYQTYPLQRYVYLIYDNLLLSLLFLSAIFTHSIC
jgi:hypothetical protein